MHVSIKLSYKKLNLLFAAVHIIFITMHDNMASELGSRKFEREGGGGYRLTLIVRNLDKQN